MARKKNKKDKRANSGIIKEYKESWIYIKESKDFIYSSMLIFAIFAVIGIFLPIPEVISKQILDILEKLINETTGLSAFGLVIFIFKNNLIASFLGMVSGIFLSIYPFLAALFNGYLVGFVASLTVKAGEISSLWRLLPHGIFELPAIFISLGFGLKLGSFIFQDNKILFIRKNFSESLRVFILVVIPLLIIAAIIEGMLMYFFR
ncbi:MAG: stage II sporulation protein M [Nanoarchaeota archaeon]